MSAKEAIYIKVNISDSMILSIISDLKVSQSSHLICCSHGGFSVLFNFVTQQQQQELLEAIDPR